METAHHTLADLFGQLGLENSSDAINAFIAEHKSLRSDQTLESLDIWSESQRQLLIEARTEDAAWSEPVDELDALLRQHH